MVRWSVVGPQQRFQRSVVQTSGSDAICQPRRQSPSPVSVCFRLKKGSRKWIYKTLSTFNKWNPEYLSFMLKGWSPSSTKWFRRLCFWYTGRLDRAMLGSQTLCQQAQWKYWWNLFKNRNYFVGKNHFVVFSKTKHYGHGDIPSVLLFRWSLISASITFHHKQPKFGHNNNFITFIMDDYKELTFRR